MRLRRYVRRFAARIREWLRQEKALWNAYWKLRRSRNTYELAAAVKDVRDAKGMAA